MKRVGKRTLVLGDLKTEEDIGSYRRKLKIEKDGTTVNQWNIRKKYKYFAVIPLNC